MNAPAQLAHVMPEVNQRPVPPALIDALKSRFGAQFSEALVVREQHGRMNRPSPPCRRRPVWCLPKARPTWPMR